MSLANKQGGGWQRASQVASLIIYGLGNAELLAWLSEAVC